jgi:ribosomal protein S18 acetylase RimI-like enzyme
VRDDELYDRMVATLLAAWDRYADVSPGAAVVRRPDVAVAVFPGGPERAFYNNAVLARGLGAVRAAAAVRVAVRMYADAGVERYAIWAHESDPAAVIALERQRLDFDTSTRAMAMELADLAPPAAIDVADAAWDEYLRVIEVPAGLLAGLAEAPDFDVVVARNGDENAAAAMAYDHDGDCGIYNVGTLAHSRRRGLGTALTALLAQRGRERGCTTASLQSTAMAERLYASVGFRDLGRFVEYVPPSATGPPR